MNIKITAIICTLLGFAAGGAACFVALRFGRIPPPPATLFTEYRDLLRLHPLPAATMDRISLYRAIQKIWPEIARYRQEVRRLDGSYRQSLRAALRPEQQEAFDQLVEQRRGELSEARRLMEEFAAATPGEATPEARTLELRRRLLFDSLDGLAAVVHVAVVLETLTQQLNLDEQQQAVFRAYLMERRQRFLAYIDENPPPSMRLGGTFKGGEP